MKTKYEFDNLDTIVVTGSIEDGAIWFPVTSKRRGGLGDWRRTCRTGVNMVQAPDLWAQGATDEGVKVCVIDSGVDLPRPDLDASRITAPGSLSAAGNLIATQDGLGHGTHVAGTIVAKNNNDGVVGVAPDAEIISIRTHCASLMQREKAARKAGERCKYHQHEPRSNQHYFYGTYRHGFSFSNNDNILLMAAAGNKGCPRTLQSRNLQ